MTTTRESSRPVSCATHGTGTDSNRNRFRQCTYNAERVIGNGTFGIVCPPGSRCGTRMNKSVQRWEGTRLLTLVGTPLISWRPTRPLPSRRPERDFLTFWHSARRMPSALYQVFVDRRYRNRELQAQSLVLVSKTDVDRTRVSTTASESSGLARNAPSKHRHPEGRF